MKRVSPFFMVLMLVAGGVWYAWGPQVWPSQEDPATPEPQLVLPYATKPEVGRLAPNFLLQDLAGRSVRLSDFLGHPVILTFWTTRCPFCLTQLRSLSQLANTHRDQVSVVAVNRQEIPVTVGSYLDLYLMPTDMGILLDPTDDVYRRYQAEAMPEIFFIDTTGVIRDHKRGELLPDELEVRLAPLLPAALPH